MKATILLMLAGLALTNAQYDAQVGPINNGKILQDVNTAVQSGANDYSKYASNDNSAYNTAAKTAVDNSQIAQAENPAYAPAATYASSYSPPAYAPTYAPAPVYEPAPVYAPAVPTYAPGYASYSEGPINWSQSKTQVNTGGQSALNKGSSYSSNDNSGRNIRAKASISTDEVAQAEEGLLPQY